MKPRTALLASTFVLMLLATTGMAYGADHINPSTVSSKITITNDAFISFSWMTTSELTAGKWTEGAPVASLTATVKHGTAGQRAAIRWTDPFYRQDDVRSDPAKRDISSAEGATLRLKLSCDDAQGDQSEHGWLTANTGGDMRCAITAGRSTATVVAGVYTVSLEGSVYSP